MVAAFGAFAIVAIVGLAFEPAADQVVTETHLGQAAPPELSPDPALSVHLPLSDFAEARELASLARTLSIPQAEQFSRECFAAASADRKVGAGEACVMFDIAFLYWRASPSRDSVVPVHFADQVVSGRHRDLAARDGASAEARLAVLRRAAFAAVLDVLESDEPSRRQSAATISMHLSPTASAGEMETDPTWNVP